MDASEDRGGQSGATGTRGALRAQQIRTSRTCDAAVTPATGSHDGRSGRCDERVAWPRLSSPGHFMLLARVTR